MSHSIVVVREPTQRVVVVREPQTSITVTAVGPQGHPGPNAIGGYEITIADIADGDVLSFASASNRWTNRRQENLTDGGNC